MPNSPEHSWGWHNYVIMHCEDIDEMSIQYAELWLSSVLKETNMMYDHVLAEQVANTYLEWLDKNKPRA
jgi:hypothetical protein